MFLPLPLPVCVSDIGLIPDLSAIDYFESGEQSTGRWVKLEILLLQLLQLPVFHKLCILVNYCALVLLLSLNKIYNCVGYCVIVLGSIPTAVYNITFVYLAGNMFTGTIPPNTFALTKLMFLDVSHNRLAGEHCYLIFEQ
jgi:hypothetical protein